MARTQYVVGPNGLGAWKITYSDKVAGPYSSQRQALEAAVSAAHTEGRKNPDGAQVLVQGVDGKFRTEWTYGKDPYPPRG